MIGEEEVEVHWRWRAGVPKTSLTRYFSIPGVFSVFLLIFWLILFPLEICFFFFLHCFQDQISSFTRNVPSWRICFLYLGTFGNQKNTFHNNKHICEVFSPFGVLVERGGKKTVFFYFHSKGRGVSANPKNLYHKILKWSKKGEGGLIFFTWINQLKKKTFLCLL